MPIPYTPTTDNGTGLLVPLFKALHHFHNITVATAMGWKITAEQARAELEHITQHMNDINIVLDTGVCAEQTIAYIRDWYEQTQDEVRTKLTELDNADPKKELPKGKEFRESLKAIETQGWALLSYVDADLMGHTEVPDAGRKP